MHLLDRIHEVGAQILNARCSRGARVDVERIELLEDVLVAIDSSGSPVTENGGFPRRTTELPHSRRRQPQAV